MLRRAFWNETEQRVRAAWRLSLHLLVLVVIGFVIGMLAKLLGLGQIGGLSLNGTLGMALVVGLATWLTGWLFDRREFAEFGLHLDRRWWADCGAGMAIGVLLMTGIFVVERAAGWLTVVDLQVGAGEHGFAAALLSSFAVFVAVGFYEELMSRGYHLRNLAEGLATTRIGPRAAVLTATLLSAAVFGLGHVGNENATLVSSLNIALAGCMLALGLLWTGELALPIGLHITWNFCQGNVYGFPVSGNPMPVRVVAIEQAGDPLITGGAFGPEAGLIGIAAMLLGVLLIAAWVRVTRGQLRLCTELSQPRLLDRDAARS